MQKMVEILDQETAEKFNVHIKFIIVCCNDANCNNSWGVNLVGREIREDQLLCQKCAVRKLGFQAYLDSKMINKK